MRQRYLEALRATEMVRRIGHVSQLRGLGIEARGPAAVIGEVCEVVPRHGQHGRIRAEVVGLRNDRVMLMPYGPASGIGINDEVVATGTLPRIGVGDTLLGRVIDPFCAPLDHRPAPEVKDWRPLRAAPLNPMSRPPIDKVLETGVRCIDTVLTLGRGQRVGIFAGSGVGKSTLLGMIACHASADVNVIALIGERGREVREFVEKQLGPEGLKRSVVIVATSDQPALIRARAAYAATAVAEYFRDQGKQVLLTMDSVTRFAMACREIGLSVGEPPTARGYTPSVFAELPELCERCGTAPSGGSITALYTVLVEGDDFNEPISDILRATLDGHLVLTRQLAQQGHYPAIDILQSASRLFNDLCEPSEREVAYAAFELLSVYQGNRQMIDMGAYRAGSSAEIDRAIELAPRLNKLFQQRDEGPTPRGAAVKELARVLGAPWRKP